MRNRSLELMSRDPGNSGQSVVAVWRHQAVSLEYGRQSCFHASPLRPAWGPMEAGTHAVASRRALFGSIAGSLQPLQSRPLSSLLCSE